MKGKSPGAILILGLLRCALRNFVYIGLEILILANLPYLTHGQLPPWVMPFVTAGTDWLSHLIGNGIGSFQGPLRLP